MIHCDFLPPSLPLVDAKSQREVQKIKGGGGVGEEMGGGVEGQSEALINSSINSPCDQPPSRPLSGATVQPSQSDAAVRPSRSPINLRSGGAAPVRPAGGTEFYSNHINYKSAKRKKKKIFKQRLKNLQAPLVFGSERTSWSPEFVLCLASVTSADVFFLQGAEGGGERTERSEPSLEGQESQLGRMNGGDLRGGKAITNGMEVHKQRR